jgi:hypothetical protein
MGSSRSASKTLIAGQFRASNQFIPTHSMPDRRSIVNTKKLLLSYAYAIANGWKDTERFLVQNYASLVR